PARDRAPAPYRTSLMGQDQERRLEGVLGLVRVAKHLAADAQDHRAMPGDQLLEGRLGTLSRRARNRSRSWPSVIAPVEPRVSSPRITRLASDGLSAMPDDLPRLGPFPMV